jgi:hypothetical protein
MRGLSNSFPCSGMVLQAMNAASTATLSLVQAEIEQGGNATVMARFNHKKKQAMLELSRYIREASSWRKMASAFVSLPHLHNVGPPVRSWGFTQSAESYFAFGVNHIATQKEGEVSTIASFSKKALQQIAKVSFLSDGGSNYELGDIHARIFSQKDQPGLKLAFNGGEMFDPIGVSIAMLTQDLKVLHSLRLSQAFSIRNNVYTGQTPNLMQCFSVNENILAVMSVCSISYEDDDYNKFTGLMTEAQQTRLYMFNPVTKAALWSLGVPSSEVIVTASSNNELLLAFANPLSLSSGDVTFEVLDAATGHMLKRATFKDRIFQTFTSLTDFKESDLNPGHFELSVVLEKHAEVHLMDLDMTGEKPLLSELFYVRNFEHSGTFEAGYASVQDGVIATGIYTTGDGTVESAAAVLDMKHITALGVESPDGALTIFETNRVCETSKIIRSSFTAENLNIDSLPFNVQQHPIEPINKVTSAFNQSALCPKAVYDMPLEPAYRVDHHIGEKVGIALAATVVLAGVLYVSYRFYQKHTAAVKSCPSRCAQSFCSKRGARRQLLSSDPEVQLRDLGI